MTRKKIAYGKLGRVIDVDPKKWGQTGGDNEPPILLLELADRNPDVDWVVVGKNRGWEPPRANIINPWQEWGKAIKLPTDATVAQRIQRFDEVMLPTFDDLDGITLWIGQHGSSNYPLPKIDDRSILTSPQISFVHYGSFLLRGINYWRRQDPINREETWLIADVRNYLKGRDLKWPRRHPILGQFDFVHPEKLERYGDTRDPSFWPEFKDIANWESEGVWKTRDEYVYSGLELVGVDGSWLDEQASWSERTRFGIIINEARSYGSGNPERQRLPIVQRWVKPLGPDWVHGTWPQASQEKLEMSINPIAYDQVYPTLGTTKSTFTTPSSGSGWATAKPWESFAVGTVCFFHPEYDTQGHILPTLDQLASGEADGGTTDDDLNLARWLRVSTPEDLQKRVDAVHSSRETYEWLAGAQADLLRRRLEEKQAVKLIEERLGL